MTVEGRAIAREDVTEGGEPIGPIAGDSVESFFSFERGVSGIFYVALRQPSDGHYGLDIIGSEGRIAFRGGSGGEMMRYPHPAFIPDDATRSWLPLRGTARRAAERWEHPCGCRSDRSYRGRPATVVQPRATHARRWR